MVCGPTSTFDASSSCPEVAPGCHLQSGVCVAEKSKPRTSVEIVAGAPDAPKLNEAFSNLNSVSPVVTAGNDVTSAVFLRAAPLQLIVALSFAAALMLMS